MNFDIAKNILKLKFGETSEIVNAYVNNIITLPSIRGTNSSKIHEFYEKLVNSVQSLKTCIRKAQRSKRLREKYTGQARRNKRRLGTYR